MKFPNPLEMQDWRYGDRPDAERDRLAEGLRDANMRADAIALFHGRMEHPFVRQELAFAVSAGAGFHLIRIRSMGGAVTEDDLRGCAEAAERNGRFLDARHCLLALGDEAGLARIEDELPRRLRPEPPEE